MLGIQVMFGGLPTNPLEQIIGAPLMEEQSKVEDEFVPKRVIRKPYPKKEEIMECKLNEVNTLLGCRSFKEIQNETLGNTMNDKYLMREPVMVGRITSPYSVIEESYLVSNIITMLMGCSNNLFTWNSREKIFEMEHVEIELLNVSNECLLGILKEIMSFASSLNSVRQGVVQFNLAQSVSQVIQGFMSAISREFSSVENELIRIHEVFLYQRGLIHCSQLVIDKERPIWHPITLEYILNWTKNEAINLNEYKRLLNLLQEQEAAPIPVRVCILLDSLFDMILKTSMHGASRIFGDNNKIWRILISSLEPYVRILAQWITKGQLTEDKYGEFFIKRSERLKSENDAFKEWTSMFVLQLNGNQIALPVVLAAEAEHIVRFGKTVKVLQFWKQKNLFSGVELQKSDLAKEIIEKLQKKTLEEPKPEVEFDRGKISTCLEFAKEKGASQFVETNNDVQYYDHMDFNTTLTKAAQYSSMCKAKQTVSEVPKDIMTFTQEINSAPYQYTNIKGLMAIQLTPKTDTSIEDIERQEQINSPKEPEVQINSSLSNIIEGIYKTSIYKYDCEALMDHYKKLDKVKTVGLSHLAKNIIDEAILNPLADSFRYTGESFTKYVNDDWRLKMHLEEWQSIYLMLDGHSMQTFMSFLFEKIDSDSPLDLFENLHEWNNSLRECIGLKKDIANNFSFTDKVKMGMSKLLKGPLKSRQTDILLIERIYLKYTSEFPLNIVMCTEAEEKYNKIFQWLLKIKRANAALQNIKEWRKLSIVLPSLTFNKLVHQFQLFEKEVGHFTRVLESFVYTRAIVPHATAVVNEMLQAKDFDSLVTHHLKRLQKIIDITLCEVSVRVMVRIRCWGHLYCR